MASDYTQKFLDEFPDGIVPIRHIPPMQADWTDAAHYLTQLIERFDAARSLPVDELDTLRDMYIEAIGMREADWEGWLRVVRDGIDYELVSPIIARMLELGLTLRQVALYVGQPPSAVCSDLTNGKSLGRTEEYVCADELLAEGGSLRTVAAATGLSKSIVENLARWRSGRPTKNAVWRAA